MINNLESCGNVSADHRAKDRLRVQRLAESTQKAEIVRSLAKFKSARSVDIVRETSVFGEVQRVVFFKVEDEQEREYLLNHGLVIEGSVFPVVLAKDCEESLLQDNSQYRVFVTNIPYGTSDEALMKFFNKFGPCEQDAIGRQSPSGKELTYCTLTYQDKSTAKMLILKKVIDFYGTKLKLLEYDASAESKLLKHKNTPGSGFQGQGQTLRTPQKNRTRKPPNRQMQMLPCHICQKLKYEANCSCTDLQYSNYKTSHRGISTQESPYLGYNAFRKSPLYSPELEIQSGHLIEKINLLDQLRQTGLLLRTKPLNTFGTSGDQLINSGPTQVHESSKPSRVMNPGNSCLDLRRRFATETADCNHREDNLRFNMQ